MATAGRTKLHWLAWRGCPAAGGSSSALCCLVARARAGDRRITDGHGVADDDVSLANVGRTGAARVAVRSDGRALRLVLASSASGCRMISKRLTKIAAGCSAVGSAGQQHAAVMHDKDPERGDP